MGRGLIAPELSRLATVPTLSLVTSWGRLWWERNGGFTPSLSLRQAAHPEPSITIPTLYPFLPPATVPSPGFGGLWPPPLTPPSAAGPRGGRPHRTHGLCSWPRPAGRERVSVPASLCGRFRPVPPALCLPVPGTREHDVGRFPSRLLLPASRASSEGARVREQAVTRAPSPNH